MDDEKVKIVEAALFISGKPVKAEVLAKLADVPDWEIPRIIEEINRR